MIEIEVKYAPPDLADRLANIPDRVLDKQFRQMMAESEGLAKQNVTGGNPLFVQTGRLRSSITHRVERQEPDWLGRLGSNVEYAAIHELGGTIPAHVVVPVKARALRFVVGGTVVFAKLARIPAIQMPERPYLRPAAQTAIDRYLERLASIDLVRHNG